MDQIKYLIPEDAIPDQWYNIQADLPEPMAPPLNPQTKLPVGPEDLSAIFPSALIAQEVSTERYIDIPDEVRQYYRQWRPSPIHRARQLEGARHPGAYLLQVRGCSRSVHKAEHRDRPGYYNREAGIKHIVTETGAGQWGTALSLAGAAMGIYP